jgi:hypothetical protein
MSFLIAAGICTFIYLVVRDIDFKGDPVGHNARILGESLLTGEDWEATANASSQPRLFNRKTMLAVCPDGTARKFVPHPNKPPAKLSPDAYPDDANFVYGDLELNRAEKKFLSECFAKAQTRLAAASIK